MPYWKEQRFEKAESVTLNDTDVIELPDTGLLDSILLYQRVTNDSDAYTDKPCTIHHHITKVEVIGNTDKILFSMTGECAIAKAFRKMGRLPAMKVNEYGNKTQDLMMPIFFGRKYKDGKYLLDLSKWDKVEVEITNDLSSSYFTAMSQDCRLVTLEDSVETHGKLLKQWEYDATKPSADGQYVRPKLPSAGLLRELMIQLDPDLTASTGACAQDPAGDSYNWKLWFKDRALTIRDHRPRDLMRDEHMLRGLGPCTAVQKAYPSTTQYSDMFWAEVLSTSLGYVMSPGADAEIYAVEDSRDRFQKAAYAGGVTFTNVWTKGVGLFHTFAIPFYNLDEEVEYLNLANYKPVEIEWYGYKDDNTHRVILEKPIGQGPSEFA